MSKDKKIFQLDKKEICITSSQIKQAIDLLVNENEILQEEIERLNNNWNELEKELEDMATLKTDEYGNTRKITHIDINWLLTKIKKLKEVDKK